MNELTFEQADQAIRSTDFKANESGAMKFTAADVAANPGDVLKKICDIYRKIKPILQWIIKFVPATWKAPIELFCKLMDTVCP